MTGDGLIDYARMLRKEIINCRANMETVLGEASRTDKEEYAVPFEQVCGCATAFSDLIDTLADFIHWMEDRKDLPLDSLVMCKAHESHLEGWRVQYYTGAGVTKPTKNTRARSGDWRYIVPLRHFHPDAPEWTPDERHNWANFGKEEDKA